MALSIGVFLGLCALVGLSSAGHYVVPAPHAPQPHSQLHFLHRVPDIGAGQQLLHHHVHPQSHRHLSHILPSEPLPDDVKNPYALPDDTEVVRLDGKLDEVTPDVKVVDGDGGEMGHDGKDLNAGGDDKDMDDGDDDKDMNDGDDDKDMDDGDDNDKDMDDGDDDKDMDDGDDDKDMDDGDDDKDMDDGDDDKDMDDGDDDMDMDDGDDDKDMDDGDDDKDMDMDSGMQKNDETSTGEEDEGGNGQLDSRAVWENLMKNPHLRTFAHRHHYTTPLVVDQTAVDGDGEERSSRVGNSRDFDSVDLDDLKRWAIYDRKDYSRWLNLCDKADRLLKLADRKMRVDAREVQKIVKLALKLTNQAEKISKRRLA